MNALTRHWTAVRDALDNERARSRGVLRTEETDFLPAALEVVERPVSPTGRVTAWLLLGLFAAALLWLVLGRVDVVASAPGKLVPADNVKLIQPGAAGIVHAILVRDGQRVRAGQPLVELDPTVSDADTAQASKALETAMLDAAREAKFDAVALTVDTIVGGNRERCLRSGFTSPPRFTASNMLSYAAKPGWGLNYMLREKFSLPNLATHVSEGSSVPKSVAEYFTSMLDQSLDWKRAEAIRKKWDGPFCLKGIVAVEDAKRAADIGATAIMVSNHGGRQLDGSISPFDALADIVDAVGDKVEQVIDPRIHQGDTNAVSLPARGPYGRKRRVQGLPGKNLPEITSKDNQGFGIPLFVVIDAGGAQHPAIGADGRRHRRSEPPLGEFPVNFHRHPPQ